MRGVDFVRTIVLMRWGSEAQGYKESTAELLLKLSGEGGGGKQNYYKRGFARKGTATLTSQQETGGVGDASPPVNDRHDQVMEERLPSRDSGGMDGVQNLGY